MRQIILVLVFLTAFVSTVFSQSIYTPIGGRAIGMGDASVTLSGFWSGFQNTAGITSSDQLEFGVAYENRYGMDGFNFMTAGVSAPIKLGHVFASAFRFGDDIYNEHKVSAGYATEIGIIQLGGKVNYLQYHIMDFGTQTSWSIDFGGIATLTPQLVIGAQALNITQSSLSKEDEYSIPTLLKLGASYRPTDFFMLNAEIEKDIQMASLIKVGAEYNLLEKFYLRSGIQSGSFQSFYGLGFKYLSIQWDYALSNHPELGFSHAMSLHYALRKK